MENTQLKKLINIFNSELKKAIDKDGDPIPIIDYSGTQEEPFYYEPIQYSESEIIIKCRSPYKLRVKGEYEVEKISKKYFTTDGIDTVKHLIKMLRKSVKIALKENKIMNKITENKIKIIIRHLIKEANIESTQRNLANIQKEIKTVLLKYKTSENNDEKIKLVQKLKDLQIKKKDLDKKLNSEVEKMHSNAELDLDFIDQLIIIIKKEVI